MKVKAITIEDADFKEYFESHKKAAAEIQYASELYNYTEKYLALKRAIKAKNRMLRILRSYIEIPEI